MDAFALLRLSILGFSTFHISIEKMNEIEAKMLMHVAECKCAYSDRQNGLFGKRCQLTIGPLYYDLKDRVFHLKDKPGRHACKMIQNTKKSFYLRDSTGVLHEYFYDSYEGWYIRSYYHGFRINQTCEASAKYRQCDAGLELNCASFDWATSRSDAASLAENAIASNPARTSELRSAV